VVDSGQRRPDGRPADVELVTAIGLDRHKRPCTGALIVDRPEVASF
jgi:hypothetical protein